MWTYTTISNPDELYHYGVKGMKWGVRKKRPESDIAANVRRTKEAYKSANKEFNRAYNKASGFRNYGSFSPIKKHRDASQARWEDAANKAEAANAAKAEYKKAKKARKEALKSTTAKLRKEASIADKLIYNDKTRVAAAKYIVDNNMTVAEATKKAKDKAWRNTVAFIGAYAAVGVGGYALSKMKG